MLGFSALGSNALASETAPAPITPDNPPLKSGVTTQAILSRWVVAAVALVLPPLLVPQSAPAATFQFKKPINEIYRAWWDQPVPRPITAINLDPPISAPQNPPFVGTSVPVAVQIGWLARTSPLPIVGADFAPTLPAAAQNPLLGSAVPLAVRIAWSPAPLSFIVARNLNPPISGPDNPPFRGALVPVQVQLGWLASYPAPPTPFLPRKSLPVSGPIASQPPLIGMRVPVAVEVAWLPPPAFPLPKARLSFSGPAPVPPTPIGPLDNPEDFVLYTAEIELWFLTDRET